MKRIPRLLSLCLALSIVGCSRTTTPEVRPLTVEIREELVLGADGSRPLDEQFGFPVSVDTDDEGRIYVADQGEHMLKVFNADGSLAWTAGREGQGPGEFQQMEFVLVEDDRVLVLDRRPGVVTWFRKDGSLGGVITADPSRIPLGKILRRLNDGRYVTPLLRPVSADSMLTQPALHVVEPDFQTKSAHFGSLAPSPVEVPEQAPHIVAINAGSVELDADESMVYFAPWLYPGRIHRYVREESGWVRSEDLVGRTTHGSPLSQVSGMPDQWKNMILSFVAGSSEPHTFVIHHASEALYKLNDGRLVHFSLLEGDDAIRHQVELFDPEGNLVAYGPLPSFPEDVTLERFFDLKIIHKDADDRFYVVDRTGELPVVRIVRMAFEVG